MYVCMYAVCMYECMYSCVTLTDRVAKNLVHRPSPSPTFDHFQYVCKNELEANKPGEGSIRPKDKASEY